MRHAGANCGLAGLSPCVDAGANALVPTDLTADLDVLPASSIGRTDAIVDVGRLRVYPPPFFFRASGLSVGAPKGL
jgi:hypothetical protein